MTAPDATLTGRLREALRPHGVNYRRNNIGGQTAALLRYTDCDGCDWKGGWHDEQGYLAHLADVAAQTVAAWLRQQRETVAEELLNTGHEPPHPSCAEVAFMDVDNAADAALAALVAAIGGAES